jgi:hypothetical protein
MAESDVHHHTEGQCTKLAKLQSDALWIEGKVISFCRRDFEQEADWGLDARWLVDSLSHNKCISSMDEVLAQRYVWRLFVEAVNARSP